MNAQLIPLKALFIGANSITGIKKLKPRKHITLHSSIERDGLFNPLVVIKSGAKYQVVDGKKRLQVIRKLAKSSLYNRSTAKVPCIVQEHNEIAPLSFVRPLLMTPSELAHAIITEAQTGISHVSIAQRFDCDLDVVEDCISLKKLHPVMLRFFNNKTISFEQAVAFATIDNMQAQLDLLKQLGPFMSNTQIISAIKNGSTVIELSEDNVIILPSRGRPTPKHNNNLQEFGSARNTIDTHDRIAA